MVLHILQTRYSANEVFKMYLNEEPWYGIEQEFFMIDNKTQKPLGFNIDGSLKDNIVVLVLVIVMVEIYLKRC